MNYARPDVMPPFFNFLEEQGVDVSHFMKTLDDYLSEVEQVAKEIDPYQDPEVFLNANDYLDKIRDLQTILFYEAFRKR